MIKKFIKILLITITILIFTIFYLSIFGIKTDKFNSQINNKILKINRNINLKLNKVNYLLNPYNFTINIKSENNQILLRGSALGIRSIQSNISLKSIINGQFAIDDLQIETKEIKLNDIITLVRTFQNSPQLFFINTITKDGFVTAYINLNFDEKGKLKENYKIRGSVKKAKFDVLNHFKLQDLNFKFDIDKKIYSLKGMDMKFNDIKITSPLIEIKKNKKSLFVNGQFLNDKKKFNIKELKPIFANLFNNIDIRKVELSSTNNFSFNINKNLKLNNFKVESIIDLNQLIIKQKHLRLKPYFPSYIEEIKIEKHKIVINYYKNKINIKGRGNISLQKIITTFHLI